MVGNKYATQARCGIRCSCMVVAGAMIVALAAQSCSNREDSMERKMENAQLVVIATVSYQGSIGFGDVFDCQIKKVLAGSLEESRIRLSVLAGDKDNLQFIQAHQHPAEIRIGFARNRENEPYGVAPITGFVDSERVSWAVEFMRQAGESEPDSNSGK